MGNSLRKLAVFIPTARMQEFSDEVGEVLQDRDRVPLQRALERERESQRQYTYT